MDPNEALRKIREFGRIVRDEDASDAQRYDAATDLAEHVQALDEWLSRGGFPPEAWVEPMKRAAATAAAMAHPLITMREWAQDQAIHAAAEPLGPPNPADGELPTTHYCGDGHEHG